MNGLIPPADLLPASPLVFRALQAALFPLHLLLMNFLLGTAAVAFYASLRRDGAARRLAHALARALPVLMALAVNLGVASLLLVQVLYGQFLYPSSILMGIFWISVIPLLMLAYFGLYLFDFRFGRLGCAAAPVIGLSLAVLLVVPFIFTNNMTLMLRPDAWTAWFEQPGGTVLNLGDPTLVPRYLHFLLGGFGIGGLFVAIRGRFLGRKDREAGKLGERLGLGLFVWMTLLQMLDGLAFLATLPSAVREMLLGGDPHATGVLLAAFALALTALAAGFRGRPIAAAAAALPLVYLMVEVRAQVRSGFLQPFFSLSDLPVAPQLSPLVLFAAVLVLGLAILGWMLRRLLRFYATGE